MIFRCAEFVLIRVYEIRCWRFTPICGSRCSCRAGGGISGAMHCPPSKPLVRLPSCLRDPSASFDSNETLLSQWSPSTAISSFTSEASDISLLSQAAAFLPQGSPMSPRCVQGVPFAYRPHFPTFAAPIGAFESTLSDTCPFYHPAAQPWLGVQGNGAQRS